MYKRHTPASPSWSKSNNSSIVLASDDSARAVEKMPLPSFKDNNTPASVAMAKSMRPSLLTSASAKSCMADDDAPMMMGGAKPPVPSFLQ